MGDKRREHLDWKDCARSIASAGLRSVETKRRFGCAGAPRAPNDGGEGAQGGGAR